MRAKFAAAVLAAFLVTWKVDMEYPVPCQYQLEVQIDPYIQEPWVVNPNSAELKFCYEKRSKWLTRIFKDRAAAASFVFDAPKHRVRADGYGLGVAWISEFSIREVSE